MVSVFCPTSSATRFFNDAAKLKNFSFSASRRIGTIVSNMDAKQVNKESLIESVRKFPCLYDTRRKDYKDDGIRENAWKLVVCEVLSIDPNSSDTVNVNIFSSPCLPFRYIYSYSTDRVYPLLMCSIDLFSSPTDGGLSINPKHVLEN